MFFIGGVNQGIQTIEYLKDILCPKCGKKARGDVYVIYWYFSFFFIPLFKWGKHYFIRMKCCHAIYEIDPVRGRALETGHDVDLDPDDLAFVGYMNGPNPTYGRNDIFGMGMYGGDRYDAGSEAADGRSGASCDAAGCETSGSAADSVAAAASCPAAETSGKTEQEDGNADPATDAASGAKETSGIPDRIPRYCSSCGTELFETMQVCPQCGRKLNWHRDEG